MNNIKKVCSYLGCKRETTMLDDVEVAQDNLKRILCVKNTKGNLLATPL